MTNCCELLGEAVPCSCSCPHSSGHNGPINLQQDNCCISVLQLFISTWMEKWGTFKSQSLGNGSHIYFRLYATFFYEYKRYRARMAEHMQLSSRDSAKRIDPIWTQLCSLLVQGQKCLSTPIVRLFLQYVMRLWGADRCLVSPKGFRRARFGDVCYSLILLCFKYPGCICA